MNKIKISIVSYLNSIPFLYGLEKQSDFKKQIEISKDIPSKTAEKLKNGEVDLGLVPVAILPKMDNYHIISDYCIGANGAVKSVVLLSEVPLNEIKEIYLDYQSRTSVNLCRLLCKHFWKIDPKFIDGHIGYEKKIKGTTAAVVIGDRTFDLNSKYEYRFDLAEEWQKWKNLPFVFACWVSNKDLDPSFIKDFNSALSYGLKHLEEAVNTYPIAKIELSEKIEYLEKYIDYHLEDTKRKAMEEYLKLITNGNG